MAVKRLTVIEERIRVLETEAPGAAIFTGTSPGS